MNGLTMLLLMMAILNQREEGVENFNPYSKDLKDEEVEDYVRKKFEEFFKIVGENNNYNIEELIKSIKEMRKRIKEVE